MNKTIEDLNYESLRKNGTGSHDDFENLETIEYPFEKYIVKIIVTTKNEIFGIEEIKLNKDFLSYQQKISSKGYHDVDKFYYE